MDQHNHSVYLQRIFLPAFGERRQQVINPIINDRQRMAYQKLKKALVKMAEEENKREYIIFPDGKRMKKVLTQCIPYTAETWAEYLRDRADRDNKQLINFIDKVFFEDGGLQFKDTQQM